MKRKRYFNFTLVELLIVISIIAILASIMLPALSKAKKATYKISCANKEKQLMTAALSYVSDNNDQLPVHWSSIGEFGYLPFGNQYTIYTSYGEDAIARFKKKLAPFLQCPEDTVFGYISGSSWYCTSYAKNIYLGENGVDAPKISQISKPSNIIWAIDSTSKRFSKYTPNSPLELGGNRHLNGWNAVFVDGHVRWGTSTQLDIGPGGSSLRPE